MAFPTHRFEEFGALNRGESEALAAICGTPRFYKRNATIRPEGDIPTSFYILADGWVASEQTMRDGGRQIMKIHLPGDAVGTPSMCMSHTVEALVSLTEARLIEVTFAQFGQLLEEHPRVAARFMLSIQCERVALMDRLASIGRTSAIEQTAAFLLDLADRLMPLQLVKDGSFLVMVTQQQMADLLGLTNVHVNRMLTRLEQDALIVRDGQRYTILDRERLEQLADKRKRRLSSELSWLPKARSVDAS